MSLVEHVRRAGVVGAGGGGFPTHVKLAARADTVIANGAECEPLLHKDAAVMEHQAAAMVRGMLLAMEALEARTGIVGIKAKKKHAVDAVRSAIRGTTIRLELLGDYYPAGDEYDLVYSTTGRLIPPGGIPLNVGAVVNNVETFVNIAAAAEGRPVTHKTVTLAGAVKHPVTLTVPVGTPFRDAIEATGGFACAEPVYMLGGLMMGQISTNLDEPITKTSTGVVVLPREHRIIQRKLQPPKAQSRIGKSACDQCRYCTEYCPRFLLGYAVEPHQVMRSLAFTSTGKDHWNSWAALCCACGLCTLFACPEELFPKEACDQSKAEMREAGVKWTGPAEIKPHPMREGRRVPIQSLARRLHVLDYDHVAPWEPSTVRTSRLILPLRQGAGLPNHPLVKAGDRVQAGQPLGSIPEKSLGAILHAPCAAVVEAVTQHQILLKAL
jgi:Na+-translocating ferredoxin:NAD+ oxidoreductase RnfC subunit